MKKLIFIFIFIGIISNINSQPLRVVPWYDWSSPIAFQLSASPFITGYGSLSNSLSETNGGVSFYECNGEYYPINSWADYYYWYTQKYWYQFYDPELYAFYYRAKDDFGMAQYICGANYCGRMYPSRIIVTFPGRYVYINNLSRHRVKHNVKTGSWVNKYYIAEIKPCKKNTTNRKEIDRLITSRNKHLANNNIIYRRSSEMRDNRNRVIGDNNRIGQNTRETTESNRTNSIDYSRNTQTSNNRSFSNNNTGTNRTGSVSSGTTNRTSNTTNSGQTRSGGTSRAR